MSSGTKAQLACIVAILWMALLGSADAQTCPNNPIPDPTCDDTIPNPCTLDCRSTSGMLMCSNQHPPRPSGFACGTHGACAKHDTCNGSGACIDIGFMSSSTVCRSADGACDVS